MQKKPISKAKSHESTKPRRTREELANLTKTERQLIWGSRRRKLPYSAHHPTISDRNFSSSFTIPIENFSLTPYNPQDSIILIYKQGDPVNITKTSQQKGESTSEVDNANPSKHKTQARTGSYARKKICRDENCQREFNYHLELGSACLCGMERWQIAGWRKRRRVWQKAYQEEQSRWWQLLREQTGAVQKPKFIPHSQRFKQQQKQFDGNDFLKQVGLS